MRGFLREAGDYHFAHEPTFYAVRAETPLPWQEDRTQTMLWSVPNLNPMGGTRDAENTPTGHGTQKPVAPSGRSRYATTPGPMTGSTTPSAAAAPC